MRSVTGCLRDREGEEGGAEGRAERRDERWMVDTKRG